MISKVDGSGTCLKDPLNLTKPILGEKKNFKQHMNKYGACR